MGTNIWFRQGKAAVIAVAVLGFAASQAEAGYINFGDVHADEFTLIGSKWLVGENTAHFVPPASWGTPGGASWSIIGPGVGDVFFDVHGVSTDFSAILATIPGGINAVLNLWAAVSGFNNLGGRTDGGGAIGNPDVAGGVPGDIRIGAYYIDGDIGPNVLAHAFQPAVETMGAFGSVGGDTHFDNGNLWHDELGNPQVDPTGRPYFDTFTVMLHELGHALGLGHSAVAGSVMEAIYAGPRRTLHADDIAGIQFIYGRTSTVPEPGTFALLGLGLVGLVGVSRRRRKAQIETTSEA